MAGEYLTGKYTGEAECRISNEAIKERLARRLQEHAAQADKITRLLDLLERNPDFEELLNLTRDVG